MTDIYFSGVEVTSATSVVRIGVLDIRAVDYNFQGNETLCI
jgi:hypothetical protein